MFPNWCMSGAHVKPGTAQVGNTGMASVTGVQWEKSVDVETGTLIGGLDGMPLVKR